MLRKFIHTTLIAIIASLSVNGQIVSIIDSTGCSSLPDPDFFTRVIKKPIGGEYAQYFQIRNANFTNDYVWNYGPGYGTSTDYTNTISYQPGEYTVTLTVTDEDGCAARMTKTITFLTQPQYELLAPGFIIHQTLGCGKLVTHANYIPVNVGENPTLDWSVNNTLLYSGVNPTLEFDTTGWYSVSLLIDNFTNRGPQSVYVSQPPNPRFTTLTIRDTNEIVNSFEVLFSGSPQPYADTVYHYVWDFLGDSLDNYNTTLTPSDVFTDIEHQKYLYPDSGYFYPRLRVYYGTGRHVCASRSMDTIHLDDYFVKQPGCPTCPNVSNVVYPYSNGPYNKFGISSNGYVTMQVKIFSRTGALIYERTDNHIVWDCTTKDGDILGSGIYYYTLELLDGSGYKDSGFFYVFNE